MSEALEINESEFDGFFLEITFDGEDDATMLFVADKDFESLKEMARDEEADWEDFKNELMELLEHSGHEEDHELSESTTEEIRDVIAER
jgi:hypothetical protein